jgi:hypothetical protein
MGLIKETAEDAAVTIDKARAIREWASVSFARVLFVMLLIESILLGATYAYVDNLLTETKKKERFLRNKLQPLGKSWAIRLHWMQSQCA